MSGLSLRLRVFLIFAALAAGLLTAILAGALAARMMLLDAGAPPPGLTDALVMMALIAGFGATGLTALVWYLFDIHVARPIETLAGHLLTGAQPDAAEGRYLADLAPATRAAADRARAHADLDHRIAAHAQALAHETSMLENILADIGAGAILTDAQGRVMFYNAAAAQLLPGLALDRDLARFLTGGGLQAAQARIAAGAAATDVALLSADGARLAGRLRPMADETGGSVLILRPARRELLPPRGPGTAAPPCRGADAAAGQPVLPAARARDPGDPPRGPGPCRRAARSGCGADPRRAAPAPRRRRGTGPRA